LNESQVPKSYFFNMMRGIFNLNGIENICLIGDKGQNIIYAIILCNDLKTRGNVVNYLNQYNTITGDKNPSNIYFSEKGLSIICSSKNPEKPLDIDSSIIQNIGNLQQSDSLLDIKSWDDKGSLIEGNFSFHGHAL